jgi:hypothetical protein
VVNGFEPPNFRLCVSYKSDSGLSCLFEIGVYFFVLFSLLEISMLSLFIYNNLLAFFSDNSISFLESFQEIIGLYVSISFSISSSV